MKSKGNTTGVSEQETRDKVVSVRLSKIRVWRKRLKPWDETYSSQLLRLGSPGDSLDSLFTHHPIATKSHTNSLQSLCLPGKKVCGRSASAAHRAGGVAGAGT